jgi:drug/metabolite transporter (DMT)-like permease
MDPRSARRLAGAVLFGGIIGPVLLLTGLSMASAASVALWLNLETVATAFLARYFFKEHLGPRTWLAVGLIVIASVTLSGATLSAALPGLLVALACLCWGLDNNLTAVIDQYTPAQITFVKGLVAGIFNTSLGLLVTDTDLDVAFVGPALGIGALAYGASILLYVSGAQQLGATRSQLIFSTAPAWGIVLAWGVLGEAVEALQLVAAGLMALAIWLWLSEQHEHKHAHSATSHTHWHRHDDAHHEHAHADGKSGPSWHSHQHTHEPTVHSHEHRPDLHHRHDH